jgi:7,8-dihydropterin-6-yl-methyl-4-(beta-D-ribofuranosyl)aminobenzene 5'-phosphate synthase
LLKYDNDQFHGLYGGLHISPFDDWDPKYDDLVISLRDWHFERIGCNHCTGIMTANKLIDRGYPVIKGTARYRSKNTAYLGNGDNVGFGSYENI